LIEHPLDRAFELFDEDPGRFCEVLAERLVQPGLTPARADDLPRRPLDKMRVRLDAILQEIPLRDAVSYIFENSDEESKLFLKRGLHVAAKKWSAASGPWVSIAPLLLAADEIDYVQAAVPVIARLCTIDALQNQPFDEILKVGDTLAVLWTIAIDEDRRLPEGLFSNLGAACRRWVNADDRGHLRPVDAPLFLFAAMPFFGNSRWRFWFRRAAERYPSDSGYREWVDESALRYEFRGRKGYYDFRAFRSAFLREIDTHDLMKGIEALGHDVLLPNERDKAILTFEALEGEKIVRVVGTRELREDGEDDDLENDRDTLSLVRADELLDKVGISLTDEQRYQVRGLDPADQKTYWITTAAAREFDLNPRIRPGSNELNSDKEALLHRLKDRERVVRAKAA